ncbi:MAG TPA: response regulator [Candidatus Ornithocaccomicrobium faecavium]|uniref:Stage 0 sporulation protein A homolog n=1 Tax=Candidatus Ornithocaccomicrobium faecavium TaxID=2840890 RepID=A0A9D1P7E5_9FIRM|nr:response regulator [Candidatus Ornithocaccomicrobium faecavium]
MNERILIVDEDKNIRDLLASALKASGYGVLEAQSFAQARMLALSHCPDLMLLELNLPDGDGLDLIRFLRAQMDLPMVVVSVRAHQRDKVEALDGGADDYITKPFGIPELLARIRAALRHARRAEPSVERPSAPFRVYDLVVDYAKRRAFVSGEDARLTPMEYRIVELLSCHAGKVLTHDMLLAYLWGPNARGNNRLLRVNMANIRRKLEKDPAHPQYIFTAPRVGYRMAEPGE